MQQLIVSHLHSGAEDAHDTVSSFLYPSLLQTVRVLAQSEGYGPIRIESYKFPVNNAAATFGGSHLQYVDYDRSMFANFMSNDAPASDMVTGMGEMIENVVNLKGDAVGKRNGWSETPTGAHYSNTGELYI